jgi:Ca2+-binding RTX toxin-like protein
MPVRRLTGDGESLLQTGKQSLISWKIAGGVRPLVTGAFLAESGGKSMLELYAGADDSLVAPVENDALAAPVENVIVSGEPRDVAYNADRSQMYVARSDGFVSIIDAFTGVEISSILVGTELTGIDVSADGKFLLAVDRQGNAIDSSHTNFLVHRVDLATGVVTDYAKAFWGPEGPFQDVALLADGTALLTTTYRGSGPGEVYRLDPETGIFTTVIHGDYSTSPAAGASIVVSADRLHAFIHGGFNVSGSAMVLELAPDGTVGKIASRPSPANQNLAYSYDGSLAAYNAYGGLTVFDGALNQIAVLTAVGSGVVALAFDDTNENLYAFRVASWGNNPNEIVRISTSDWSVVSRLPVAGSFPLASTSLTIGPDGAYFALANGEQLIRIDNTAAPLPVLGSNNDDAMGGTIGADILHGLDGNDSLQGFAGNDTLRGGSGNDLLDGGTGHDMMFGGDGDDVYIVDDSGDRAAETSTDGGSDEVRASASFVLEASIERLVLTGVAAIDGTGNDSDNLITGNDGDNVLRGMGGDDTLTGGSGNDELQGGTGADTLIGGIGDDSYYLDDEDTIIEAAGEGNDTLVVKGNYTLAFANIENLRAVAGIAAATLTGDGGDNRIEGNGGINTLNGAGGNDALFGMGGNDTLLVSHGHDTVDGGAGVDTLRAYSADMALPAGPRNFTLTATRLQDGSGTIDTGFTAVERIDFRDSSGAGVTLDASGYAGGMLRAQIDGGQNIIIGSAAADTFVVVGGSGTIDAGGGADIVSLSFDTSTPGAQGVLTQANGEIAFSQYGTALYTIRNAEMLALFSSSGGALNVDASALTIGVNFTGTAAADTIIGSSGANVFNNFASGTGDVLTGGGGADIYRFTSAAGLNGVTITDFASDDRIDLSAITPQAHFIGAAAFSGTAGEYRYASGGGVSLLLGDGDGDGVADHGLLITSGAFVLGEVADAPGTLRIVGQMPANDEGPNVMTGTDDVDYLDSGGGDDTIDGRGGNDVINAGDGNDRVNGGTGDDAIHGDDGNDVLSGGAGMDFVYGDDGNDTITETGGSGDWLMGGLGNDTITATSGKFTVFGDEGDDRLTLTGGSNGSWVEGGEGNDVIAATGSGTLTLGAGTGDDTITIGGFTGGFVHLAGGNDTLRITGGGGYNLDMGEYGGMGRDKVVIQSLTAGLDVRGFDSGEHGDVLDLSAFGADPLGTGVLTIVAAGSDAYIQNVAGGWRIWFYGVQAGNLSSYNLGVNNPLYAPVGMTLDAPSYDVDAWQTQVIGGDGNDTIRGHGGSDMLYGGGGADWIDGGAAQDTLDGGSGSDVLTGGTGHDSVWGGDGSDLLDGGAGDDTIVGGAGIDTVSYAAATAGVEIDLSWLEDQNTRGAGTDTLISIENLIGSGFADVLAGDAGANVLSGGGGNDRFVFGDSARSARDTIADFTSGDVIDLSAIDANGAAAGDAAFEFIDASGFGGRAGQLRATGSGTSWLVEADLNGDGIADFSIAVTTTIPISGLAASDFLL